MVKKRLVEDRRRSTRAKRILTIRHRLSKRKAKTVRNADWHLSMTEDMSATGLLFATAEPYQIKDVIELQVVISGVLDIFRGYAKVVRVQKKASGVMYQVAVAYCDLKSKAPRRTKSYSKKLVPSRRRK